MTRRCLTCGEFTEAVNLLSQTKRFDSVHRHVKTKNLSQEGEYLRNAHAESQIVKTVEPLHVCEPPTGVPTVGDIWQCFRCMKRWIWAETAKSVKIIGSYTSSDMKWVRYTKWRPRHKHRTDHVAESGGRWCRCGKYRGNENDLGFG